MSKVVISIDLDAFYCAVEQHYDTTLTDDLPFIVYQKNCVATLSYPARALGIKKLSTVSEALKRFPNIRLVNGESLAKYRQEGKSIFEFVSSVVSGSPMERLGLEELRIDLTEVVEYNLENLRNMGLIDAIRNSEKDGIGDDIPEGVYLFPSLINGEPFFCENFFFSVSAKIFPPDHDNSLPSFAHDDDLLRLYIGAQLANHLMERLSLEKGYYCSIGLAHNKSMAKMVCSLNKPRGLTVLLPKYVKDYLDPLPVSTIPGFGHKTTAKLLEDMTTTADKNNRIGVGIIKLTNDGKTNESDAGAGTTLLSRKSPGSSVLSSPSFSQASKPICVRDIRTGKSQFDFVRLFGSRQGPYLWHLLHGIDDNPVKEARDLPTQISIEDTYKRLDSILDVTQALSILIQSLLRQIHTDLIDTDNCCWKTYPSTFRLTVSRTDGNPYSVRKSKSCRFPTYLYDEMDKSEIAVNNSEQIKALSEKILYDVGMSLFYQLCSLQKSEKLSVRLLNVAVTDFLNDKPSSSHRYSKGHSLGKQSREVMDRFLKIAK